MSEFDRVGSAIDFRDAFRSRAGGFAPPTPSLFDNGNRIDDRHHCDSQGCPIASDCGRVASRRQRCGAPPISVKMRQSV